MSPSLTRCRAPSADAAFISSASWAILSAFTSAKRHMTISLIQSSQIAMLKTTLQSASGQPTCAGWAQIYRLDGNPRQEGRSGSQDGQLAVGGRRIAARLAEGKIWPQNSLARRPFPTAPHTAKTAKPSCRVRESPAPRLCRLRGHRAPSARLGRRLVRWSKSNRCACAGDRVGGCSRSKATLWTPALRKERASTKGRANEQSRP